MLARTAARTGSTEHRDSPSPPRATPPTRDAESTADRAHVCHREMIARGSMWRLINKHRPLDDQRPIAELGRENIHMLRAKVGDLSTAEKQFFTNVMAQPWFLTHFTSARRFCSRMIDDEKKIVTLKSFDCRQREQPSRVHQTNASPCDIEVLGGTDFVYLCLELGRSLKKPGTRTPIPRGERVVIRTPLEQPALADAMSLHGDLFDGLSADRRLRLAEPALENLNKYLFRFENEPLNAENGFARTVFHTPEAIKEGTTLQTILDARQIPQPARDGILTRTGSAELNDVVTSLSRTQVMGAEQCSFDIFEIYSNDPQGALKRVRL